MPSPYASLPRDSLPRCTTYTQAARDNLHAATEEGPHPGKQCPASAATIFCKPSFQASCAALFSCLRCGQPGVLSRSLHKDCRHPNRRMLGKVLLAWKWRSKRCTFGGLSAPSHSIWRTFRALLSPGAWATGKKIHLQTDNHMRWEDRCKYSEIPARIASKQALYIYTTICHPYSTHEDTAVSDTYCAGILAFKIQLAKIAKNNWQQSRTKNPGCWKTPQVVARCMQATQELHTSNRQVS